MENATTKSKGFSLNQTIPLATAAMAGVFLWLGLSQYGFWHDSKGPMSGFFPVVISSALLLVSIATFFQSFSEKRPTLPLINWLPAFGVVLILGATLLLGMVPSLALYVVLWLRLFEKYDWKTTLVTTTVIMAIVIGCFVIWLGVPFPQGLIYEAVIE